MMSKQPFDLPGPPPRMKWTSKEYVHLKTSCILIKSEKEIKVHRNYITKFKEFVHIESERKKKIIEEDIQTCKIFMKIKSKGNQNPWKEYTQTIKLKGIQDPCPIIINRTTKSKETKIAGITKLKKQGKESKIHGITNRRSEVRKRQNPWNYK